MLRRGWIRFLAGTLMVVTVGLVGGPDVMPIAVQVIGWAAVVVLVPVDRHNRGGTARVWRWFAAGGALCLLAGIVRFVHGSIAGVENPFPSPADALFVPGYLALILGADRLRRARTTESQVDDLVDALIVSAGLATVAWAAALAPYVRDTSVPLYERGFNVGYSVMALLLLVAFTRLAVGPGSRNASYYLLSGGIALFFVSDVTSTLDTVGKFPAVTLFITPFIYICFGTAALHPSMPLLTRHPEEPNLALSGRRVLLLAAALLMAPAILVWQLNRETTVDLPVVITGSVVLSLLVLARLSLLVRANSRQAVLEQELRRASSELVAATNREEMNRIALDSVQRIAGSASGLRASVVSLQDDGRYVVVDAAGHLAERAVGTALDLAEVPASVIAALDERSPRSLGPVEPIDLSSAGAECALLVAPLVSQNELRGAMVVSSVAPLSRSVRRAVEALVSTVSLALESAALSEDLHRTRSERRFRTLIENSSDIVIVLDDQRHISFVSPASERLLGRTEDTLIGTDPIEHLHPDDQGLASSLLERRGASFDFLDPLELRIRHLDGSYRWFEVLARDLRDVAEIGGVVVNCREISDRKDAELQLFRSEARFRALVQNVSDVVAIIDDHGRFTYVSPAITPMLGFRPEELIGTRSTDLITAEELAAARAQHPGLIARSEAPTLIPPQSLEVRLRTVFGEWRTIDVTVTDLRLEPAVAGIVLNARDVTLRKELEHNLRHQALHDALTGLANRTMFAELVDGTVRGTGESGSGVLFIDLDDFKTVNDSLGHAVGDELLIGVAERLARSLPEHAIPARLGGDEFAVLVEDSTDDVGPVGLALRLLNDLRRPFRINGREIMVTASIGIAAVNERAPSAEVVLRNADMAMYLAKERGKDRVELFEEQMHASAFERLELKADLARGIEAGQLRLVYQPIVSLQTGRITGVEALVRWDHPERGRLSPDAFIALAEDTGLIVPLGQWVLEEACQQLRAWQLSLPTSATVSMSVNLSVRQLERERVVNEVSAVIDRFGLDPSTVTLEITESMVMDDTELTSRRLAALRAIGVQLAVDDFGTGYSSLRYMEQFPVDVLKIDRTFIDGLGGGQATPVVQSIVELAQRLGVHIVAEGIERREQLEVLQSLGCDLGQGYFFSGPVEADALADLLAASLIDGRRFLFQQGGGPGLG